MNNIKEKLAEEINERVAFLQPFQTSDLKSIVQYILSKECLELLAPMYEVDMKIFDKTRWDADNEGKAPHIVIDRIRKALSTTKDIIVIKEKYE